jgi:hypothetical protein
LLGVRFLLRFELGVEPALEIVAFGRVWMLIVSAGHFGRQPSRDTPHQARAPYKRVYTKSSKLIACFNH